MGKTKKRNILEESINALEVASRNLSRLNEYSDDEYDQDHDEFWENGHDDIYKVIYESMAKGLDEGLKKSFQIGNKIASSLNLETFQNSEEVKDMMLDNIGNDLAIDAEENMKNVMRKSSYARKLKKNL